MNEMTLQTIESQTIVTTVDTIDSLAIKLRQRQPIDPVVNEDDRIAAVAEVIKSAGAALAVQTGSPHKILNALEKLETLAGIGSLARKAWLAVRSLDLRPGEIIGGEGVDHVLVRAVCECSKLVVSRASDTILAGFVGDNDTMAATNPRTRSVVWEDEFNVYENDVTILTVTGDVSEIFKGVEGLASRNQSRTSNVHNGAQPLSYDVIAFDQIDMNAAGDELFQSYSPKRISIPGAQPHPTELVESMALASVLPPEPTYKPILPQEIVTRGILSDVQLETVIYAGQAHQKYLECDPDDDYAPAPRQGFMIGAGTGVGKTRMVGGVIRDNWLQGRQRAVWVTERARLLDDISRDWTALGGRKGDLFALSEIGPDEDIPSRNGILFVTYSMLRGEGSRQTRVEQIERWLGSSFDGVIAFDECHNLANALPVEGMFGDRDASKQGEAALSIQRKLPNARILYVSATGAADIDALGFAIRLGIWGRSTPFPNAKAFFEQMRSGGVNALEMIATSLKAMGLYMSVSLSFKGVEYERMEIQLSDEERAIQDTMANAWARVADGLNKALHYTGVMRNGQVLGHAGRGIMMAQFASAKQRFFQALLSSLKMPQVIEAMRDDIKAGFAPVVQFTNTYEATAQRAIAASKDPDYADIDLTPRDIILQYMEKLFPVYKQRIIRQGKQRRLVPVLDANGNPIPDPSAIAERDRLITEIKALDLPEGPMEQILAAFGPDRVAEVTGRTRRVVVDRLGRRKVEDRSQRQVSEDIRAFQAGLRDLLFFSLSGSAGSGYHAAKDCGNKKQRIHYIVQVGWRADLALQGMGRTHRANQACPPRYVLVLTDLWADKRALSTIADRMESLGALTRGQRQAASQGFFTSEDNLESPLSLKAWRMFVNDLEANAIQGMTLGEFEFETGLNLRRAAHTQKLRVTGQKAKEALNLPPLTRFLNQVAGMTCAKQDIFGGAFQDRVEQVRLEAIAEGTFDRGIETLEADSLVIVDSQVVRRDPRTGAETELRTLLRRDTITPTSFGEAVRAAAVEGAARFGCSRITNRVSCVIFPTKRTANIDADTELSVITPAGRKTMKAGEVWANRMRLLHQTDAEQLWNAELSSLSTEDESELYVLTGCLLPVWDKLERDRVTVYRMETDLGERLLGRIIRDEDVNRLIRRLDASTGGGIPADEALEALERGETATLDNGWVAMGEMNLDGSLKQVSVFTMKDDPDPYRSQMVSDGFIVRPDLLTNRDYFVLPTAPAARHATWSKFMAHRAVVGMTAVR